jgi:hypothetical protein
MKDRVLPVSHQGVEGPEHPLAWNAHVDQELVRQGFLLDFFRFQRGLFN